MNNRHYIRDFAESIKSGSGALFLGAGLSASSGLPTWKELLRPFAETLSIDIDNSNLTLYDIAQICENEKGVNLRNQVKEKINTIPQDNSSLEIITKLPCKSIWTTNYDCFLEDAFRKNGVSPNIISTEKDLTSIKSDKRVSIFKLNGDIRSFNTSAVITKVDYEKYSKTHSLMQSFLKKELITHSFLFIGYSFSDNLILSSLASIRESLEGCDHMTQHYAILKRETTPEFQYVVKNLERNYNIKTIVINEYDEIPKILNLIKYYSDRNNIFISGAFRSGNNEELEKVNTFCQKLALGISGKNYRIINGYGFKVGYYIACALTNEMIKKSYVSLQDKMLMYPFNEHASADEKTRHREFMISKANVALFIYGSSEDDSGIMEEFRIAQEKGLAIIPVGGTGGAAQKIYNYVRDNIIHYPYLEKEVDILGASNLDDPVYIQTILKCIDNATKMQDDNQLSEIS